VVASRRYAVELLLELVEVVNRGGHNFQGSGRRIWKAQLRKVEIEEAMRARPPLHDLAITTSSGAWH
jgi:hypothetical protein